MKIGWLCMFNVALGIAAGAVVAWIGFPFFGSSESFLGDAQAFRDLIAPLTAAFAVIGSAGTILATTHFALVLRRACRHVDTEVGETSDRPIPPSLWHNLLAPLLSPDQIPPAPELQLDHRADRAVSALSTIVQVRLLRRHWRMLAVMQVWTATAALILEPILVAWRWNSNLAVAVSLPVSLCAASILVMIAMSRWGIRSTVGQFMDHFKELIGERFASHRREFPDIREPISTKAEVPPSASSVTEFVASVVFDAQSVDGTTKAGERVASLYNVQSGPARPQAAAIAPATSHEPQGSLPEVGYNFDSALAEIISAIDSLKHQQTAIMDAIQAVANALRSTASTHLDIAQQIEPAGTWIPRLQELIENMITRIEATEREATRETTKLRDEMRARSEIQERSIAELSSALSRLEVRIVPALRRVSSANRAMTLVVERLSRVEKQPNQVASLDSVSHPAAEVGSGPHTDDELASERGIVSELRQLMTDLEEATTDPPQERPSEQR